MSSAAVAVRPLFVGLVLVMFALMPTLPRPAQAQAAGMAGVGETETATTRATVKAIDVASRTVTLVGPQGEIKTLKVGPEVQNFPQVKAGDIVVVRYRESVAYIIAPPGTKTPEDLLALAAAQATPGEMPAAAAASKIVVTGLVVGVSPAAKTISVVNPDGGEVRTLNVKDPDYQRMLPQIKVGDTVTAVISEAVAAAVEPAK